MNYLETKRLFLDQCEIPTSSFNRQFAENDGEWDLIIQTYHRLINSETIAAPAIPKILHFIWIGSKLPNHYWSNICDWESKTGIETWIWDDKNIEDFLPTMRNRHLFEQTDNFGIKSDLLRYEILNKYGGIYVDTDFLCLDDSENKIFKTICESCSFFAGQCLDRPVQVNNGIMGSCPEHPILEYCIKNATLDNPWGIECKHTRVLYQTGPWLLTAALVLYLKSQAKEKEGANDVIVFPSQSFHPLPATERFDITEEKLRAYIKPHSYACHLWHSSWQDSSMHFMGK